MPLIKSVLEYWVRKRMRDDWNRRARENAFYYVDTANSDWSEEAFVRSGEMIVKHEILGDMENVCRGQSPDQMRVLEIGCGVGRVTRALAKVFKEVHAVDISGEMVARAREFLHSVPNVHVHQNSGSDLKGLGSIGFDFAFSFIVFQHIPSLLIIESYIKEVGRVLKPGALFKLQVQGQPSARWYHRNSWLGTSIPSESTARRLADRCGFEARHFRGEGTQYFWLWLFKKEKQGSKSCKL